MIAEKDNHDFVSSGRKNKMPVSGRHQGWALKIFVLQNCSWQLPLLWKRKLATLPFQAAENVLIQTDC